MASKSGGNVTKLPALENTSTRVCLIAGGSNNKNLNNGSVKSEEEVREGLVDNGQHSELLQIKTSSIAGQSGTDSRKGSSRMLDVLATVPSPLPPVSSLALPDEENEEVVGGGKAEERRPKTDRDEVTEETSSTKLEGEVKTGGWGNMKKGNRFRTIARMIKTNVMWSKNMNKSQDEENMAAFVVNTKQQETLVFDKNVFKASQRSYGGITLRARAILMKHNDARTEDELVFLKDVVDRLKCFDKYTRKVKHELARVINYERFENGRIIIQQGHIGMSFYFIIAGSVIVTTEEIDKKTGQKKTQVVGELTEGSSFGELALMHNIKRAATIVCKGLSEFLRVDKDDFEDVLRNSHYREWRERVKAIEAIPQFAAWSQQMRDMCNKASKLMECVVDSLVYGNSVDPEPDDIYFIVSGECRIVREVTLYCRNSKWGLKKYHLSSHPDAQAFLHRVRMAGELPGQSRLRNRRSANKKGEIWTEEKHFWSIGSIGKGFFFSVGENFKNTYIMAKTRSEFLVVPRLHFMKTGHTRTLDKMKEDLDYALPDDKELFDRYFEEADWDRYKQEIVCGIVGRSGIPRKTTLQDVPMAIQLDAWRVGSSETYKTPSGGKAKEHGSFW